MEAWCSGTLPATDAERENPTKQHNMMHNSPHVVCVCADDNNAPGDLCRCFEFAEESCCVWGAGGKPKLDANPVDFCVIGGEGANI